MVATILAAVAVFGTVAWLPLVPGRQDAALSDSCQSCTARHKGMLRKRTEASLLPSATE